MEEPKNHSGEPSAKPENDPARAGEDEELAALIARPRRWPWLVAAALLLGGGAASALLLQAAPDPSKVLVAVNVDGYWWEGSQGSAIITDVFGTRLAALGFEPIQAGDPKVMEVLQQAESPQAAAKTLGAAFVVSAELKPELIEHALTPTYYEGRVQGAVWLSYAMEKATQVGTVDGWSGSRDAAKAKELLGTSVADKVFDVGMPALMKHAVVQEVLVGGSAVDRGKLTKATRFLEIREGALKTASEAYSALLDQRLKAEEGQNDQKYHGKLDEDVVLGAVTPNGILSQTTKIRPFYNPVSENLGYYRDLDGLYWTNASGERTELTRAYNLFGYPASAPDGNTVVFVEDIFGWAKAISVVRQGGSPQRLRVDPDHYYSSPAVAMGGAFAALYDRPCRKCLNGVLVIELEHGKTIFERQEQAGEPNGFTWLDAERLLVVWRPVPSEEQEGLVQQGVYLVNVKAPKADLALLQAVEDGATLSAASADRAGQHVVFRRQHDDGRALAVLNVTEPALVTYDVAGSAYNPVIAPDGKSVAFEQDNEIVHYVLESGTRTQLTRNAVRDRYPVFSPDGTRIFYESLGNDPNFPKERNVSVVGSVKVP